MHYIFEAIFVGIYSSVIAIILSFVVYNYYYLLFLTGFIKHVGGYYLNIHTYYCNYGDACTRTHSVASSNNILIAKLLRLTPSLRKEFNHSPSPPATARSTRLHNPSTTSTYYSQETSACKQAYVSLQKSGFLHILSAGAIASRGI